MRHRRRQAAGRISTPASWQNSSIRCPFPQSRKPAACGRSPRRSAPAAFRITACPCAQSDIKVHRDLTPTRLWTCGFVGTGPDHSKRAAAKPLLVEWANELPPEHFLPIDHNLHGAEADKPRGAHGRPRARREGSAGAAMATRKTGTCRANRNSTTIPTSRTPAMLWYHDHAMGINRLNIYAGLFGALTSSATKFEDALNLPSGKYEIPLSHLRPLLHPRWPALLSRSRATPTRPGCRSLRRMRFWSTASCFPYLEVEPRKYRFRILNGSNSRFYRLSLRRTDVQFQQIGTDQGSAARAGAAEETDSGARRTCRSRRRFQRHAGEKIDLQERQLQHHAIPRVGQQGQRHRVRCPRHCVRFRS